MFGLKYFINNKTIIEYFMSQRGLNKRIYLLRFKQIKFEVLPNVLKNYSRVS